MSRLADRVAADALIVTAELPVIDGGGTAAVERALDAMEGFPDAVNATDNTAAHAHASSLAVAVAIQQAGMEPIMQLVCRDRNRLALQADIAGAALHGIENICCLTGDDVTAGDEPESRRVFDLDSIGLIATASALAGGQYLSGRPIDPAPRLFVGAVENPGAPPHDYRVRRAVKKVRAGARFLQLQCCFEADRLKAFMSDAVATGLALRAALLPSIIIVRGASALRFMDDRVPGISVPRDVIAAVEASPNQADACFELACDQAAEALSLPGVRGLHLISFRRDGAIGELCRRLGIPSQTERNSDGHGAAIGL